MEPTDNKIYSINIELIGGLEVEDYKEFFRKVKTVVTELDETIIVTNDDGEEVTDSFIQSIDLLETSECECGDCEDCEDKCCE